MYTNNKYERNKILSNLVRQLYCTYYEAFLLQRYKYIKSKVIIVSRLFKGPAPRAYETLPICIFTSEVLSLEHDSKTIGNQSS